MTATRTYSDLLREYLCGARQLRPGYWQEYKRKAWRLFGVRIRNNPKLRAAVLERAEKRRHNPKVRRGLLVEEFLKRDYVLRMVEKDNSWQGGTLVVPFRSGASQPIRFGAPLTGEHYTKVEVKEKFTVRLRKRLYGLD